MLPLPWGITAMSSCAGIMRRIVVVGPTGCGKTTVARALANRLSIPHVEFDALYWGPNWTPTPNAELLAKLESLLEQDTWVVDHVYGGMNNLVFARAQQVVWLDYALTRVAWQLICRTLRRRLRREELWNGNREQLRTFLFSRDSLFLWLLKTYEKRKREYAALRSNPAFGHLVFVQLHSRRETRAWLKTIGNKRTEIQ